MREYLTVFDCELSDEEMTRIATHDGATGPNFDHRDWAASTSSTTRSGPDCSYRRIRTKESHE
jgi:hypothetical protein